MYLSTRPTDLFGSNQNSIVRVKWNHFGTSRRFQLRRSRWTFEGLMNVVREFEPEFNHRLTYKDADGDTINFSTTLEMEELLLNASMDESYYSVKIESAELKPEEEKPNRRPHPNIICDGCDHNICGTRYKCITCDDFDLCECCEKNGAHGQHAMLRLATPDTPKPYELFFGYGSASRRHTRHDARRDMRQAIFASINEPHWSPREPSLKSRMSDARKKSEQRKKETPHAHRAERRLHRAAEMNDTHAGSRVEQGINAFRTFGSQLQNALMNMGFEDVTSTENSAQHSGNAPPPSAANTSPAEPNGDVSVPEPNSLPAAESQAPKLTVKRKMREGQNVGAAKTSKSSSTVPSVAETLAESAAVVADVTSELVRTVVDALPAPASNILPRPMVERFHDAYAGEGISPEERMKTLFEQMGRNDEYREKAKDLGLSVLNEIQSGMENFITELQSKCSVYNSYPASTPLATAGPSNATPPNVQPVNQPEIHPEAPALNSNQDEIVASDQRLYPQLFEAVPVTKNQNQASNNIIDLGPDENDEVYIDSDEGEEVVVSAPPPDRQSVPVATEQEHVAANGDGLRTAIAATPTPPPPNNEQSNDRTWTWTDMDAESIHEATVEDESADYGTVSVPAAVSEPVTKSHEPASSVSSYSMAADENDDEWMLVKKTSYKSLCDFYEQRRREQFHNGVDIDSLELQDVRVIPNSEPPAKPSSSVAPPIDDFCNLVNDMLCKLTTKYPQLNVDGENDNNKNSQHDNSQKPSTSAAAAAAIAATTAATSAITLADSMNEATRQIIDFHQMPAVLVPKVVGPLTPAPTVKNDSNGLAAMEKKTPPEERCYAGQPFYPIRRPHNKICHIRHANAAVQDTVDMLEAMGYDNCNGWLTRLAIRFPGDVSAVLDHAERDPLHLARVAAD